jgi:alpha-tubulin suppressor-like RCC1 family protein
MMLGYRHVCALARGGALFCWLGNEYGQLGNGGMTPSTVPFRVPLEGEVVSAAAGYSSTYALLADGRAFRWGRITSSASEETLLVPSAVSLAPNVRSLQLGASHTCVLRDDDTVACWGTNGDGELGNGTTEYSLSPEEPMALGPVASLAVGYGHACAAKADGSLFCWGDNYRGQLGLETHDDALVPTEVTALTTGVTQVATRNEFTCALLGDATVACWGRFSWNDTVGDPLPRLRPELTDVTEIAAGNFHACALKSDGSLWCWAGPVPDALPGIGATVPEPFEAVGTDNTRVWAGYNDTCVRKRDETIWCWGARIGGTPTQIAAGCQGP